MKYLLMGRDYKTLYIENEKGTCIKYIQATDEWKDGGFDLKDARVGFDPSEDIDSPYRFGNPDCMLPITEISKEEAESIVGKKIDADFLFNSLKRR